MESRQFVEENVSYGPPITISISECGKWMRLSIFSNTLSPFPKILDEHYQMSKSMNYFPSAFHREVIDVL